MASERILKEKQKTIDEIKDRVNNSASVVLFDYRGLTDEEIKTLRRELRNNDSDYKVYKNTLMSRAFNDLGIDLSSSLTGPSAFAYSKDQVAAVKTIANFKKDHDAIELKAGIIDGSVCDKDKLNEYATIPSRDGLLTMLAGSMIGLVRDLSICLDLYAKQKEEN